VNLRATIECKTRKSQTQFRDIGQRADETYYAEILLQGRLAPTGFRSRYEFVCNHVPDHPLAIQNTILAYTIAGIYTPRKANLISFDELHAKRMQAITSASLRATL